MPNYRALAFQIWRDSLHRLQSHCWETARRSIRPDFSVHPVGKTMRWIKKWLHRFWWSRRALSPRKVWGRSSARAGSRCENMVFVCLKKLSVTLRVRRAVCSRGALIKRALSRGLWVDFNAVFSFFWKRSHFQMHYTVRIFAVRWHQNFREIAVENFENSKNRRKSLCAPLRIDRWETFF